MPRPIKPKTLYHSTFKLIFKLPLIAILTLCGPSAFAGDGPWPSFTATTLILTPSRNAAKSTREWVNTLRSKIDHDKYRIRDVLAVNLPFFMSEEDAIGRAKEKVPQRYHDQTWILNSQVMEEALGVPSDSDEAVIVVLDKNGDLISQVHGKVTTIRMNEITNALQSLARS